MFGQTLVNAVGLQVRLAAPALVVLTQAADAVATAGAPAAQNSSNSIDQTLVKRSWHGGWAFRVDLQRLLWLRSQGLQLLLPQPVLLQA
jgi:hypothetical protein